MGWSLQINLPHSFFLTEWGGSSAPGLHLRDAFQIDSHTVCRYRNGLFL